MFAGFERVDRDGSVEVVRQSDADGVHVVAREKPAMVDELFGNAESFRGFGEARTAGVGDGHELGAWTPADGFHVMPADLAGADDGNAEFAIHAAGSDSKSAVLPQYARPRAEPTPKIHETFRVVGAGRSEVVVEHSFDPGGAVHAQDAVQRLGLGQIRPAAFVFVP